MTAYDQFRYLKNKDTLSYTNKTYAELLSMIATDYHLQVGTVADTKYKIPSRIEEGTLLDILQNASDILVVVVDEDTAKGYDYESSRRNTRRNFFSPWTRFQPLRKGTVWSCSASRADSSF